ncbi:CFA74 protein, partial [Thinocorus orbignyianus]|nr:CFA74 protein [Thinocorus orbignyianus]
GHGVTPTTVCSVGELDMGYVITGEQGTSTFKIQNTCSVPLPYSLQLDSLSSTEDEDQQKIPSLVTSPLQRTGFVGTQNYDGLSAFSISPAEGELVAGNSQDFTVTFSPDHESLFYSDRLKAVLFGKKTAHVIHLKGAARDHPMFVEGGIPLEVPVESLAVPAPALLQEALAGGMIVYFIPLSLEPKSAKSILLVLECLEGESSAPARAELRVGSIHTPFVSKKVKSLEFSFESPQVLQQKGFTLEATKGKVERGRVKRIGVSWVPPAGCRAGDPLLVTALLTLKYDVKETYQIFLMARVVSAS